MGKRGTGDQKVVDINANKEGVGRRDKNDERWVSQKNVKVEFKKSIAEMRILGL